MAFKSRSGKTSGVCRDCSGLKDAEGGCDCTRTGNSWEPAPVVADSFSDDEDEDDD